MKSIGHALFLSLLFICLSAKSSEGSNEYEIVNCVRGFCVGNDIIAVNSGLLNDVMGTILEIRLKPWQAGFGHGIIVPEATVETRSGKIDKFDLRSATLAANKHIKKCLKISDREFCTDDDVVVNPDYAYGNKNLLAAKVWIVADIQGFGLTNENKTRLLSIYKSENGSDYVTSTSPGFAKEGACFGRKGSGCIGEKYNNGLRSEDEILAYFPLNDEFYVKLGDLNKVRSLYGEELSNRKAGTYLVTKTAEKENIEKAEISNKKNIQNAKNRVLSSANEKCRWEFFGQGVLDPQTSDPKITNCSRYIDKGGFSHGPYGPSLQVRCQVDFTYNCIHKLR